MKKWHRLLLLVCVISLLLGGCCYVCFGTFTSRNVAKYEELLEAVSYLPEMDELGAYVSYDYVYRDKHMLIFYCESHTLTVKYGLEDYATEKAKLDEVYHFETEKLDSKFSEEIIEPQFLLDGYEFSILSLEHYEMDAYPHEFVLIGTNDIKNEIVYLYIHDPDLDSLESFPEYLKEYCGWRK